MFDGVQARDGSAYAGENGPRGRAQTNTRRHKCSEFITNNFSLLKNVVLFQE